MVPHPRLPEELLSMIIDIIGATTDSDEKFTRQQLASLRATALASKRMQSICRVYIFSIVEVGFHGAKERKLMRLVGIMERNPDLKLRVRVLKLHASGSKMSASDFERCRQILLGFSNLRRLNSRAGIDTPQPDSKIHALRNELVAKYISKGSLRSLSLANHDPLRLSDVLSCPKLQSLELLKTGLLPCEATNYRTHNLAFLSCNYMPQLPLSTLHHFPNLQRLDLQGFYDSTPPEDVFTASPQLPPFGLRSISLKSLSDEFLLSVLNYFVELARVAHRKPFLELEKIHVAVDSDDEIEVVRDLLEHVPSLQDLYFEAPSNLSSYALLALDNDIRFQTTCRTLASLSLELDAFSEDDDAYATLFEDIHAFFESISGNNVLERLALSVNTDVDHAMVHAVPSSEPWSQFFKILASDINFPKLTYGDFGLCLHVLQAELREGEQEELRNELDNFFLNVEGELAHKPNFELGNCIGLLYVF